jgi:hypothetical protein
MAKTKLLGTPALLLALTVGIVACDDGSTTTGGGGDTPRSEVTINTGTLEEMLASLEKDGENEAQNDTTYTLVLEDGVKTFAGAELYPVTLNGATGVWIKLTVGKRSDNTTSTSAAVGLSAVGSLFTVSATTKLIVGDKVTLFGLDSDPTPTSLATSNAPLVVVGSLGEFIMETGSAITNVLNATVAAATVGGAVRVNSLGKFTMNGGEISSVTSGASDASGAGAGVYVAGALAVFNMKGGNIVGNAALKAGTGGGVYVADGGAFNFEGGLIGGNSAEKGGGVYVEVPTTGKKATFTMTGGTIGSATDSVGDTPANVASFGGGVYLKGLSVAQPAVATISGGKIFGHGRAYLDTKGGGVFVGEFASATLGGTGVIESNLAASGGGVFVDAGTGYGALIVQAGAAIKGNQAHGGELQGFGGGIFSNKADSVYGAVKIEGGNVYASANLTTDLAQMNNQNVALNDTGDALVAKGGHAIVIQGAGDGNYIDTTWNQILSATLEIDGAGKVTNDAADSWQ